MEQHARPSARAVFDHAVEIPTPDGREAYLSQACADDADLRHKVDALLQAYQAADSFLESGAAGLGFGPEMRDPEMWDPLTRPLGEGPGSVIGRYKLLQEIGEGGMGVVFLAEQTHPVRRQVALKVIKAGMDTRQVVARFEAERQALAMMDHPNIAKVLDAGATESGRPYFVMELVNGMPVTTYCDQHRLTPRDRLALFVQVCGAVQHAHTKGIIHRDLKPSNVMVAMYDDRPVPKVIDFGVAKATGGRLSGATLFTGFGATVGTPQYMSPEQAEFNQLDIDTRSDVYSLGVILYELLTGSTPLERKQLSAAAMLEVLRVVREQDPPRPSTRLSTTDQLASIAASRGLDPRKLNGVVRGELDWIVMKCLEKDRTRRYETANGLAADVQRYLDDEAVQACPPTAWYRFRKFARRNKRALASAAVLALAAVVGITALAAGTVLVSRHNKELSEEAYFQRITVAHRELSTHSPADALRALGECPEDLRGWEWYYLARLCKVEPLVIPDDSELSGVAFSPDGERLASAGGDGVVKIRSSRTGEVIQKFHAHDKGAGSVVFHPDGVHLASAGADRLVKVWNLETGRELFRGPCDALRKFGAGYTVAFSLPDGRRLAAGSAGAVRVWDWKRNRPQSPEHVFPGQETHSIPVAFSDDGRRLATAGAWKGLRQDQNIFDTETGKLLRTWPAHHHPVTAMAFSPGGGRLATASLDRTVKLWATTTGAPAYECVHAGNVSGVAFSPDGRRLVSTGEDKIVRLWDAATGRAVLGLRGHTDSSGCVAFSPDGQRIASSSLDGTIRIWDATPLRKGEGEENTFARHGAELRSVAVSPNGERIASAGHGGLVKIWDAATGQNVLEIPAHLVLVWSVAWHPDGRSIVTAGSDGSRLAVKVWDAVSGREQFMIQSEGDNFAVPFTAAAFAPNPDGRYLVTGKQDGSVLVWDAQTRRMVNKLGAHTREVRGVVFSPDGRHLASASGDGKVMLWDATRLDQEQAFRVQIRARVPGPCLNIAFSPDSRRLVSGGPGNTVMLWGVQDGEELQTLRGHNGDVYTVSFSPHDGGRWIASGGDDSLVKVWDGRTGKEVRNFRGHTGVVSTLTFSADGKRLYSGSRDTTVKVWDVTSLDRPASAGGGR